MRLQDFFYELPQDLIAQYPLKKRDKARLMVVDRKKSIIHHDVFSNIGQYLPDGAILVLNDSKVIPARLFGNREKSGGAVEIFLLKRLPDGYSYEALIRPLKRLRTGENIVFKAQGLMAQIKDKENRIVRFNKKDISQYLKEQGHMPLPPYIRRPDKALDQKYYQTVYAKKKGSVASPTAGLHFTNALIKRLTKKGFEVEKVTLHVNYATFNPVKVQDITKHHMHTEDYHVTKSAFQNIKKAKDNRRPIVAVGTTSCRVLESLSRHERLSGSTNIFIYPGYRFHLVDILVTNFHFPCSTLLMLVHAFGTRQLMTRAYQEAIKEKYRFYSYGDGMMIL